MDPMDSPSVPFMTPGEVFRARIVFRRDQVEAARLAQERAAVTCSRRMASMICALVGTYLVLAVLGLAPVLPG